MSILSGEAAEGCDNVTVELHHACLALGIGMVAVSEHDGAARLHRAALGSRLDW
ncbi:hypothetical protein [Nocardia sp. NPDC057440]|uniref:hypothetical protein n=1 Tax=Nocardia sp. NPDC057440 TaxID=3346134 RepID=UPI00366BA064